MLDYLKRTVTFRKIAPDGFVIKTSNVLRHRVQFNSRTNRYGVATIVLEGKALVTVKRVDAAGDHLSVDVQYLKEETDAEEHDHSASHSG